MPFKPGHAEDDIMGGGGDVKAEEFGQAASVNEEGIMMGDRIGSRFAVGKDEGYRVAFCKTWEVVRLG
jgi:hypothetical protein